MTTNTDEMVEEKIQVELKKNTADVPVLSSIANFYEMNNRDLSKALEYIKKAMTLKHDWWYYRTAVDLEVKLKDYTAASAMAKKAIDFLQKTKPSEWENIEQTFQDDIKKIAAMK